MQNYVIVLIALSKRIIVQSKYIPSSISLAWTVLETAKFCYWEVKPELQPSPKSTETPPKKEDFTVVMLHSASQYFLADMLRSIFLPLLVT